MLPASAHVLLNIALRTAVIYLLVLIGVRLSGKREVGQMTPFDLGLRNVPRGTLLHLHIS
jgi:hypothetical protein